MLKSFAVAMAVLFVSSASISGGVEGKATYTDPTTGMSFVRIDPGTFRMGQNKGGNWDESPAHEVTLKNPFYMGTTEVTNAQFEMFDPEHKRYRGYCGFSTRDEEAAVFVSWHDAVAFCRWLSEKEGKTYRLPTEAEWEYACRAGTKTDYNTGSEYPEEYFRHQKMGWIHEPASLRVALAPANAWGLFDMHGNVEEWCHDWYGPYDPSEQTNPVGRASGISKVTRGGSHNTEVKYLRSACRLGALPENKNWLIGFRVVMGELPETQPLPESPPPLCMSQVSQEPFDWSKQATNKEPFFRDPVVYVKNPPAGSGVPKYIHNHCPSITWCPNGDLLAVWFSTVREVDREMVILGARLRAGQEEWDTPSLFFKVPGRNMTGSSLFHDGDGRILFLNGMEVAETWKKLAMVYRESTDNGATWSTPRIVNPYHQRRNQVIDGMFRTREGYLIQPCDAVYGGKGGTSLHISRDDGQSWEEITNFGYGQFGQEGGKGGWIAGIHAGVAQLADGSLFALGRGDNIEGRMPKSLSRDLGMTWEYSASEFPPISSGQRMVLTRLREGPLMLVSYTDVNSDKHEPQGIVFRDESGKEYKGYGMFAALSYDEGKTWPVKKLVSTGNPPRRLNEQGVSGGFIMDATQAERGGYLSVTQPPDGTIHLISSIMYYRFNLAWLVETSPPLQR